jgi:CRP/FNR family cyclic AMP-dependent transcriptional regulator
MGAQEAGWDMATDESRAAAPPLDLRRLLVETDIPLFRGLSKRHLRRVARLAELRQYVGSKPVVRAGSRGDAFYVILDGSAEVRTADGSTVSLQPGDYFGELALFDGAPRAATVSAVGELSTARIARGAFLKLLRQEPAIALGLLPGLVGIVRDLQGKQITAAL